MRNSSEPRQPRFPVPAPAKRPPPLQPGDLRHAELPLAGPTPRVHWPLERLDGYIACLRDALAQGLNPPLVRAMIENAQRVRAEEVHGSAR